MNNSPQSMALWQKLLAAVKDSSLGKFAGGAADMLLPEKMSDILTGPMYAARHPIDSAKLLGRGMQDASQYQFEKMYNAPTRSEAIGHGLAGAIPMLGPAAGMAGEEIGAGNTARGMGMATALLAPSLYRGGKAGAKWTGEAVDEVMAPRRAAAEALANKIKQAREWEAFNKANPGAVAGAGRPSPYPPGQGQGSMAQLPPDPVGIGNSALFNGLEPPTIVNWGDEAAAPAPAASALPSRRDALKAGGAAGIGAMLAPKLMETPKAPVPLVEAAPVLGRGAPSALAREGFYRETKHRAAGYGDPYIIKDPKELPGLNRDFDPTTGKAYSDMSFKSGTINPDRASDRFFLSRAEGVDEAGNPVYGKQVFRLGREENLREALQAYGKNLREYEMSPEGRTPNDPYYKPVKEVKRVVHSEITPEAALRLNTIEKPKVGVSVIKRGRESDVPLAETLKNPNKWRYFRIEGDGAPTVGVVSKRGSESTVQKYLDREGFGDSEIVPITPEEAAAIGTDNPGIQKSYFNRPNTVGISPRYNKRVSIRLLKDTMAEQIKENKRAARLKPPPLLAKAPVLQDNPKLSRFDFLRGIDLKKKP